MVDKGYLEIREDGSIWRTAVINHDEWKPITPRRAESPSGKGYLRLVLYMDGRTRSVQAHIVIWTRANGEIPDGLQINHENLIKTDNRLANLELVTGHQNIQHSYDNGRTKPWANGGQGFWREGRKLISNETKLAIWQHRKTHRIIETAMKFNISNSHVSRIAGEVERRNGNVAI